MKIVMFQLSLFGINSYIVVDPSTLHCAVIDPGMINDAERKAVVDYIGRNNLIPTHIINTHLHIDHVAGNIFLKKKFDIPVFASEADKPLGDRIREQAVMFGMKEQIDNVEIDCYLSDGDVIEIGTGRLLVMSVPGHSPGSVALYDKEDGFIIVGDVLFQGSVGRSDLPGGNHHTLINSIKSRILTLPDSTVVYPGHGPATTVGQERKFNPFLTTHN